MSYERAVTLTVNGQRRTQRIPVDRLLMEHLRSDWGLTGTHNGCSQGLCGACTVLVNGAPRKACLTLAVQVDGATVQTVEGLMDPHAGALHPLQQAFIDHGAVQCGFCTPGMLMTAVAFLAEQPGRAADETAVREALGNNLCRCTGYVKIVAAVQRAAEAMAQGAGDERLRPPGGGGGPHG